MTSKLHLPSRNPPLKVIKIVVFGTSIFVSFLEALLLSYGFIAQSRLHDLAIIGLLVVGYTTIASIFVRKNFGVVGNWMTLILYFVLAVLMLFFWGINAPVGLLFLGFFVFLAAVVVGPRYIIPSGLAAALAIILIHFVHSVGLFTPHRATLSAPSDLGDVITYISLFGIFSLLSWLVARNIHQYLQRAQTAEARLRQQKNVLAQKLEEQSKMLKQIQMEEMQQFYHFAEMGQSTIATLHELSNHLSVLTLDIENLAEKNSHKKTVSNTKESIKQINNMVNSARRRIYSKKRTEFFDVISIVKESVDDLRIGCKSAGIELHSIYPRIKNKKLVGDPSSISHVINILIKNAIDACRPIDQAKILVEIKNHTNQVEIAISDNGPGIPPEVRKRLFQPQKSNKENGLGIGLYITKHVIESQFKGTLEYSDKNGTCFTIKIPVKTSGSGV